MGNNLVIGLFGMYGLYNYGCEAIVRGTYELIKKAWPSSIIILYTSCPQDDQKVIEDLKIIIKRIPMNKLFTIRRIINKVFRIISVDKQVSIWNAKRVVSDCDIVFSVGGDIYTIPKYVIDNHKEKKYSPIIEFGKIILKYRPLVIWGASIGPFGEKKEVKDYYLNHLRDVNQIFCREEETFNYLKRIGVISNLQLCSDPAFYINDVQKNNTYIKEKKLRIALNLSPLSIREQIGENINSFQDKIIYAIKELATIPNSEIILVPHVVSPLSEKDNDLIYLNNIYNNIPTNCRKCVRLLKDAKGFLGTKEFLKTCDIVIAARMHCAVNAICEGIPTIFLCYSQKGLGMANHIYGNSHWAVQLTKIDKELKNKTLDMLHNLQSISDRIEKRVDEIRNDESMIVNLFRKLE